MNQTIQTIRTSTGGFTEILEQALQSPLPGIEAQLQMAPAARIKDIFTLNSERKPVLSSILVLCYERDGQQMVLFIRRPEYPGIHSGQMAFPGGRHEPGDESNLFTALRETEEEVGLPVNLIKVVGNLTPLYIPPSNYMVYPFVGITDPDPVFYPDPGEVAGIVEIPLSKLVAPETIQRLPPSPEFNFLEVPAFVVDGVIVWGATAMIAAEFIAVLRNHHLTDLNG